jgi:hypothetical protein
VKSPELEVEVAAVIAPAVGVPYWPTETPAADGAAATGAPETMGSNEAPKRAAVDRMENIIVALIICSDSIIAFEEKKEIRKWKRRLWIGCLDVWME